MDWNIPLEASPTPIGLHAIETIRPDRRLARVEQSRASHSSPGETPKYRFHGASGNMKSTLRPLPPFVTNNGGTPQSTRAKLKGTPSVIPCRRHAAQLLPPEGLRRREAVGAAGTISQSPLATCAVFFEIRKGTRGKEG